MQEPAVLGTAPTIAAQYLSLTLPRKRRPAGPGLVPGSAGGRVALLVREFESQGAGQEPVGGADREEDRVDDFTSLQYAPAALPKKVPPPVAPKPRWGKRLGGGEGGEQDGGQGGGQGGGRDPWQPSPAMVLAQLSVNPVHCYSGPGSSRASSLSCDTTADCSSEAGSTTPSSASLSPAGAGPRPGEARAGSLLQEVLGLSEDPAPAPAVRYPGYQQARMELCCRIVGRLERQRARQAWITEQLSHTTAAIQRIEDKLRQNCSLLVKCSPRFFDQK